MTKRKRIIVSVTNDLFTDQRVHKVCTFLQAQGYSVLLVGRQLPTSQALDRTYDTHRMKLLFRKGPLFYAAFSLRLFCFLLVRRADYLLANDLDTLLPNFLIARLKRVPLVYDSHEYFTEVPELVQRPKVQKIWEMIEKWTLSHTDFRYTVNSSIAARYEQKYGKSFGVVRNISPVWQAENLKSRQELDLPDDRFILIFQGAGINIDRGAEELVQAMRFLPDCLLLFVGDGDVVPKLKETVQREKWHDRIRFIGKKPYAEMMNFTYLADVGVSLDKDTNINYRYSLPNKIFDYLHTQTPILASNLIEVKNIVETWQIGRIVSSHEPAVLAENIRWMKEHPDEMQRWKTNCLKAREQLNWENETTFLNTIFPLLHGK